MRQQLSRATRFVLPLLAALLCWLVQPAMAEQNTKPDVAQKEMSQLAGADFWRQVRQGEAGYTTSHSPEHGVLISKPGETWFILKEKWMSPAGAVAIFGSIAMVVLAYIAVGPLMLSKPRTGRKLNRWSRSDRALHWSMAFTFLTLAFSGLMLVYGKYFLKMLVLLKWWRKSIFNKVDMQWFIKLGGMVGKHKGTHPSAGFSNAGEKAIYWLLIVFGTFAAISGLVLDFPIFGQTRRDMEWANLIHMFSALILICGFIFHIYIGLFGMEGALEGMVTGKVDETWAKEHHDLWYEEVKRRGEIEEMSTPSQMVSRDQTNGEVSHESR